MNQETVNTLLTPETKKFLNELHNKFDDRIASLLIKRKEFYQELP